MSKALIWFRRDLRCSDNPALLKACQHDNLLPLYLLDEEGAELGAAQHWWLHHSLASLQKQLQGQGLTLYLRRGNPLPLLQQLIHDFQIDYVYWNRCYEPAAIARDSAIKKALQAMGVHVESTNGSLFNEPWTVKTQSEGYFKVFTPYWKQSLKQITLPAPVSINRWPKPVAGVSTESLKDWQLLPSTPNWASAFGDFWQPGEEGALQKLELFIDQGLRGYKERRNQPALTQSTSRLSPHLHFGEISPWQIGRAIEQARRDPACDGQSADHFLSELGWREFSYHLLYHYPALPERNFRSEFDAFVWENDQRRLKAWQLGKTGYPLVDAGMRELWQTGYMHNRVRMIAASFLTKHLLIDWRLGASWFWSTLLDADLANNSASWQWVAGSGADAAPYFRIFNPVLQGEKFDAEGEYVRRWLPELSGLDNRWIHQPWNAPPLKRPKAYPAPLVDHNAARVLALARYRQLKA
ncbi:deoxyribodipyrimidine photo-lyase [Legionella sp. MW5194]|uniref:cryptochrome/photolyase family protein n=1 Tax=Legionella sp. MW5194 TaxID=2662448 RepID=UPI00193E164B|nr:deoxyribodipyrimidine photo-lyase [Legionella sp. MW5194]QRN02510.1 deoxyribodipyrimidine photo-lyase [Legionella sp. MW5194]